MESDLPDGDEEDDDEWESISGEEADEGAEATGEREAAETAEMVSLLLDVPNLLEMRDQFLHDPQQVLQEIQRSNPRLFQLIATHNARFLELVQSESLLQTLRDEQLMQEEHLEELEEMDEEQQELLAQMLMGALEQEARVGSESNGPQRGEVPQDIPGEDMEKIEQLMQLGFTREQCVAAFYRSGRNAELAANMLFDNPPTI
jgi:hypothetical protein